MTTTRSEITDIIAEINCNNLSKVNFIVKSVGTGIKKCINRSFHFKNKKKHRLNFFNQNFCWNTKKLRLSSESKNLMLKIYSKRQVQLSKCLEYFLSIISRSND